MAALQTAFVELEGPEEGLRTERPGDGERVIGRELEAVLGDEGGGVGLRRDVVDLADAARVRCGRDLARSRAHRGPSADTAVPLHRRDETLRISSEQRGEDREAGREATEKRVAGKGRQRAKECDLAPERAAGQDDVRCERGDGRRIAEREVAEKGEIQALGFPLEAFAGEAREGAGTRDDGDRRTRAKSRGCPRERDEVPARGRGDGDDGGKALNIVGGGAVVPDGGPRARPGDRASGVAAVRAENEAASPRDELGEETGRAFRPASVIEDEKASTRTLRPELDPQADLPALHRIAAGQRNDGAYYGGAHARSTTGGASLVCNAEETDTSEWTRRNLGGEEWQS